MKVQKTPYALPGKHLQLCGDEKSRAKVSAREEHANPQLGSDILLQRWNPWKVIAANEGGERLGVPKPDGLAQAGEGPLPFNNVACQPGVMPCLMDQGGDST